MTKGPREQSFTDFFRTATSGFTPYGWQLQVAIDGLPDVLPIPTGLGKTETALAWAWRLLVDNQPEPLHLVVCLPMRSLGSVYFHHVACSGIQGEHIGNRGGTAGGDGGGRGE